jgi:tRNA(Ile)-lysidine synthase
VPEVAAPPQLPISPDEADQAFQPLRQYEHYIIAVSGGADSTALMHLAAEWLTRQCRLKTQATVVTVDHGLRPESAAEAALVRTAAAALGLPHVTMTDAGPRPASPFAQAWARDLRYRLLAEVATRGPQKPKPAILTAHHQDDQAETVLMRLARGSGVRGLAAIRPVRALQPPQLDLAQLDLLRPLLGFPKARLLASLIARDITWIDDPSNTNTRFERVRLRTREPARTTLGLESPALARVARRAARADAALDTMAASVFTDATTLQLDPLGFARLHWPSLLRLPAEIRLRCLEALLVWISATRARSSLGQLEAVTEARDWAKPLGLTSHGCAWIAGGIDDVLILPERGRLPDIALIGNPSAAPQDFGPFRVAATAAGTLKPLGDDGLKTLKNMGLPLPAVPHPVLLVQPALVDAAGHLTSAPTLGLNPATLTAQLRRHPLELNRQPAPL